MLRDPGKVGTSLAITYAVLAPLTLLVYMLGRAPARKIIEEQVAAEG